nr:predicted GPI-anchored protein 58 [Aegilops tauschii subsp. strangulata]
MNQRRRPRPIGARHVTTPGAPLRREPAGPPKPAAGPPEPVSSAPVLSCGPAPRAARPEPRRPGRRPAARRATAGASHHRGPAASDPAGASRRRTAASFLHLAASPSPSSTPDAGDRTSSPAEAPAARARIRPI